MPCKSKVREDKISVTRLGEERGSLVGEEARLVKNCSEVGRLLEEEYLRT